MNRKIIALAVTLLFMLPAAAQDVVNTVNGDAFKTGVTSIDKEMVNVKPVESGASTITKLPRNYIRSIEFADGFTLDFLPDGSFDRSRLSEAPTVVAKGSKIYAEGIIKLNDDEARGCLGDSRYYLAYKPMTTEFVTGLSQLFSGTAMFIGCAILDNPHQPRAYCKEVVFRNDKNSLRFQGLSFSNDSPLDMPGRVIHSGHINPYLVATEFLGVSTIATGLVNVLASSAAIKKIAADQSAPVVPLGRTKAQYWAGIGMTAAGVGALVAGTLDMNAKKEWYNEKNRDPRYDTWEDEMPTVGAALALAGSVLINVGLTEFLVANTRLQGYKSAGSAPLALNVGPTTHGYGMTLAF